MLETAAFTRADSEAKLHEEYPNDTWNDSLTTEIDDGLYLHFASPPGTLVAIVSSDEAICFERRKDALTSGEWKRQHGSELAGPPTRAARS